MADTPAPPPWRSIDELAAVVGAYCWLEQRIFAVTGAWATRPAHALDGADDGAGDAAGDGANGALGESNDRVRVAELRVWCAATSRRHGALAARWAERLPVRAGVDPDALITPPASALAAGLDELAGETDLHRGVAALVHGLLPGLDAIYDEHARTAPPVREGPVLEVLTEAHREMAAEIRGGRSLIGGFRAAQTGPEGDANFTEIFKQLLSGSRVFPAVRTS